MKKIKIILGADHLGLPLKNSIKDHLVNNNYEVEDIGVNENNIIVLLYRCNHQRKVVTRLHYVYRCYSIDRHLPHSMFHPYSYQFQFLQK